MAEARAEDEEESLREARDPVVRRAARQNNPSTDRADRRKPEHRHSQGALSSIRAVIKRTSNRTTSVSETPRERDRRRPEITILSAEPLVSTSLFPGASGGFPPAPPPAAQIWGSTIPPSIQPPPSYEEVIREKTREQTPPPPPSSSPSSSSSRRSIATTTIATQTDTGPAPLSSGSVARRPVKPPRPSFPLNLPPSHVDDIIASPGPPSVSLDCGAQRDLWDPPSPPTSDPPPPRSVVIVAAPPGPSPAPLLDRPEPRPRSKPSLRPIGREVRIQTLVKLREDGLATLARTGSDVAAAAREPSQGKYLQELLDAFSTDDWGFPDRHSDGSDLSQSDEEEEEEEEQGGKEEKEDMAALRARIQAFEQQQADGNRGDGIDGNAGGVAKRPEPRPRPRLKTGPSVAPKPSVATRPPSGAPTTGADTLKPDPEPSTSSPPPEPSEPKPNPEPSTSSPPEELSAPKPNPETSTSSPSPESSPLSLNPEASLVIPPSKPSPPKPNLYPSTACSPSTSSPPKLNPEAFLIIPPPKPSPPKPNLEPSTACSPPKPSPPKPTLEPFTPCSPSSSSPPKLNPEASPIIPPPKPGPPQPNLDPFTSFPPPKPSPPCPQSEPLLLPVPTPRPPLPKTSPSPIPPVGGPLESSSHPPVLRAPPRPPVVRRASAGPPAQERSSPLGPTVPSLPPRPSAVLPSTGAAAAGLGNTDTQSQTRSVNIDTHTERPTHSVNIDTHTERPTHSVNIDTHTESPTHSVNIDTHTQSSPGSGRPAVAHKPPMLKSCDSSAAALPVCGPAVAGDRRPSLGPKPALTPMSVTRPPASGQTSTGPVLLPKPPPPIHTKPPPPASKPGAQKPMAGPSASPAPQAPSLPPAPASKPSPKPSSAGPSASPAPQAPGLPPAPASKPSPKPSLAGPSALPSAQAPGLPPAPASKPSPKPSSAGPSASPAPQAPGLLPASASKPSPKPSSAGPSASPATQASGLPAPAQRKNKADGVNATESDPSPRPSGVKLLPLRPPPMKTVPGRPPPPQIVSSTPASEANQNLPAHSAPAPSPAPANPPPPCQPSPSSSSSVTNQLQGQTIPKRGPPLPPRPSPGHPLHTRYVKQDVLVVLETGPSQSECLTAGPTVAPLVDLSEPLPDLDVQPEILADLVVQSKATSGNSDLSESQSILPVPPSDQKDQLEHGTVSGPRCEARFDYEGEEEDELTFSKGDVIALHQLIGQDWGRGQIHGRIGIFPLNFTEVLEPLPGSLGETKVALETVEPGPSDTPDKEPQVEEWASALFDYPGQTAEDLSFHKGALIRVLQHVDSEWDRGRVGELEGLYPSSFTQPAAKPIASQKLVGGVAKVMFDFTAESKDELSLKVGAMVTEVELVDEEWFMGSVGGKRGLIPKDYISLPSEPQ